MPHESPRVCVVGSANMDLTFHAARLPRPGETLVARSFAARPGGKGANQAVMAARLGAQVGLVGRVGADAFGRVLLDRLRAEGIDLTHVRHDPARPTGVASIVVESGGQNAIVLVPGANGGLTPDDVQSAADLLRQTDVVVGQHEVPAEATLEAFRIARAAGVRTIFNPAPAGDVPGELLALTDVCIPNETELEALAGRPLDRLSHLEDAAREALRERGVKVVLVTLADRGVLRVDDETVTCVEALPVKAVDATGAGDAFVGSLAVFLAEGRTMREAVERANAVAALSVTRPGTQDSYPRRDEAEAFLADLPT